VNLLKTSLDGGNGGYTFQWDNGESTVTATSLDAGIHVVTVTDSKRCSSTCSVTINEPSEVISCTVTEDSPVICRGESNGVATVSPIGGNGNFTFEWDNGETTATAIALNAGFHVVTVTDSKECFTTCSILIGEPNSVISCNVFQDSPVICFGEENGVATVSTFGGNCQSNNIALAGTASSISIGSNGSPSRINDNNTNGNWSGGSIAHTAGSSVNDWIDLDLGDSQEIKNIVLFNRIDQCCSARLSNSYLLVSTTPFPNNSNINTSLANAEFVYQLGNTSGTTSLDITIQQTGRYIRVQKSGNNIGGNTLQLAEIQVFPTCYTYVWDNGETTATAIALDAGQHVVTVSDIKGCTSTCSVTINEPFEPLTCIAEETKPVECNLENSGEALVIPEGGNGGYSYLWNNGETTAQITNLSLGLHTITVTDLKGCITSCSVEVTEDEDCCKIIFTNKHIRYNAPNPD